VRENLVGWIFFLPTAVFFCGWAMYPIAKVLWISFTDYHFISRPGTVVNFVGLRNYITAFEDPVVLLGLGRAALFTALFLPGTIFIPLLLAILIDRVRNVRVAGIYRTILLIPAVVPGPLIFVLWKWIYNFDIGPINTILVSLHIVTKATAPQWIGPGLLLTMSSIAAMEVWWGLGYHTMFFLAGIAAIPHELFEAARVDGANEWTLFWQVTWARMRPILLILVVLRFGSAMAVIDEYIILGGFNQAYPTYAWTVYMWDIAFQRGDWFQGYAAAIGWIGALAMLVVVSALFWIFRNQDG
jgi:multiple sugar transport system permease protein